MNQYGSYRKLLDNSKQAMLAAIEIYNKPQFAYREEVFTILLINAWELLLLAILSKKKQNIFQPKKRGKDYRTWSFSDSTKKAAIYFPHELEHKVIFENLFLLEKYRNNAVHYYNTDGIAHCIYVLAQAAIKNYRDLVKTIFKQDIVHQINLVLLPLSFNEQPDFVEFFKSVKKEDHNPFVKELFEIMRSLESQSADTTRLITQCTIKLESTKKIKAADIIAGIDNQSKTGITIHTQSVNPDDSHPFFQIDIIGRKTSKKNPKNSHENLKRKINSNDFQAIIWKHNIKNNKKYCWVSKKGGAPRYSFAIIEFINSLSDTEIEKAKSEYNSKGKPARK